MSESRASLSSLFALSCLPLPPWRKGSPRSRRARRGISSCWAGVSTRRRRPLPTTPLTASLLANDRGENEASLGLAEDLGAGFVVVDGRWDRGKGFFTTPAEDRVPASARAAFDSWSVGLRGVAPLSDTIELQARGLVFRDDRTLRFEGALAWTDAEVEGSGPSAELDGNRPAQTPRW